MPRISGNITTALRRWQDGDPAALNELTPLVLRDLRILALHHLGPGYRREHSLQTTELINEFYAVFSSDDRKPARRWRDRKQFFAFAGQAMRNLLLDHLRRNLAQKRGGHVRRMPLEDFPNLCHDPAEVIEIGDAVQRLERLDPIQGQIVNLRFFVGLTLEETAGALGLSLSTLKREWRLARLWLQRELGQGGPRGAAIP